MLTTILPPLYYTLSKNRRIETNTLGYIWNGLKIVSYGTCRKFPFGIPGKYIELLISK